jgi:hypothetical protein
VRDQANVVIVDLNDANAVVRRPITADSAIMHPTDKILALKAGRQLQVFNIATKQKLKAHLMNEEVVFWKWLSKETLGVVTETAVFHWDLNGADAPVKVRSPPPPRRPPSPVGPCPCRLTDVPGLLRDRRPGLRPPALARRLPDHQLPLDPGRQVARPRRYRRQQGPGRLQG